MYSKHTCATCLFLKTPLHQKSLVQVGVFKISPQRAWHIGGPTSFGRAAVPLCELMWAGIVPSPRTLHFQGPLPALFSSHLLCLSDIVILLTETVSDCWGRSKPSWQDYKHVMIYSPALGLYHSLCWEMSIQEIEFQFITPEQNLACLSNPHVSYCHLLAAV